MKKFLSCIVFLGVFLCLTGCGNKPSTLTCTQKVSSVNVELTSNFIGKEIKSMSLKYHMDLSSYSDTYLKAIEKKDFCSSVQNAMSQFTLVDCNQKVEDKQLLVTAGIDLAKLSKSDLTGSPDATKVALEKQGYTCTLK